MSSPLIDNGGLRLIQSSHRQWHDIPKIPIEYGLSMSRVKNPEYLLYR
ncbi:hypothetical protein ACXX82_00110 [Glaciimonas sp. GNP009]